MSKKLPVPDPPEGTDLEAWNAVDPELHAEAARVARNLMKPPPADPPDDEGSAELSM